jgi:hypothetical protein
MYLMFGDEADKDHTGGKKFFVYGAIWCPSNSLAALHAGEVLGTGLSSDPRCPEGVNNGLAATSDIRPLTLQERRNNGHSGTSHSWHFRKSP